MFAKLSDLSMVFAGEIPILGSSFDRVLQVKRSRSPWVQWRCNRALAATAVCCTVRSFAMESGAL